MTRTLTTPEARAFYDRFGARQDAQAFYEDRALDVLIRHADFGSALRVFEFGCGTGRFAERLLSRELPADARYLGIDLSPTMVGLASRKIAPFGDRAEVRLSGGSPRIAVADGAFDRFVSTYVLDLLAEADIRTVLREAHRVLAGDGRLCLVGLTRGDRFLSRLVTRAWSTVHALCPVLVGGCRPVVVHRFLDPPRWRIMHREVVTIWGVPSEVLVAAKL